MVLQRHASLPKVVNHYRGMCLQECGHQLFAHCMKFPRPLAKLQVPPTYELRRNGHACVRFPEILFAIAQHLQAGLVGSLGGSGTGQTHRGSKMLAGSLRRAAC